MYEECAENIVSSLMDGFNGTILAYGQTGAGKTFTMTGASESYKHRGVIPRAISQVFKEVADRPQNAFVVRISYLEIYNEIMADLLRPEESEEDPVATQGMSVIDDENGNTLVKGLSSHVANSEEEALNLLFEGETNRHIAEHHLNKLSSRYNKRTRPSSNHRQVTLRVYDSFGVSLQG